MSKKIILASGSPRRRELMDREGFEFTVITSKAEENYDPSLPPHEIAQSLAKLKAQAVASALPAQDLEDSIVIGADTIVALDGVIYGKPVDASDACRMLRELSGKTHQVITGVCIICNKDAQAFAQSTNVNFKELSGIEIQEYVASGEPLDKAGAYGIQGLGGKLADSIDGDFDNVVGLPIKTLAPKLRALMS